jgi:hypothetical protein
MNATRPSYYAVIPASVRYDKTLSPNAKLLYGEITALCEQKGYCWASNAYFANLYTVSDRSVTSWLSDLVKGGHIECHGRENRIIKLARLPEEIFPPLRKKLRKGVEENCGHSITPNITSNKDFAKAQIRWKPVGFEEAPE